MSLTLEIGPAIHADERPDWHDLDGDEKFAEWQKGGVSPYADHPQFALVFCPGCGHEVFPIEGNLCPWSPGDPTHDVASRDAH